MSSESKRESKMSQNFMTKPSSVRFNILVVDDDYTSLSIVSAMLRHWDYDVVSVSRPVEALDKIRILQNIDVVVTDLHMPEMNGLELQQQINEEFKNLPVMIISSDDRESVIMKALASGVVFYIVKPLNPADLKNVWQYAYASKKGKSIYIEETGSFEGAANKLSLDDNASASSVNEQKKSKKKKASKKGKAEEEGDNIISAPKKAKVAWTNSLHNRFLQAIRYISLEKAVPKKILEFMNVPGLTRENVASHLQKYRIFLKRVAEKGLSVSSNNFPHRSGFAAAHSETMLQEAQEYAQIREKQQQQLQLQEKIMRTSPYLRGFGGGISYLYGSLGFPSLGASSSNPASQLRLLRNQANFHQSPFGNTTNTLYQANPGTNFGTGSNDVGANSSSSGGLSGGLMNRTNSNQMYQQIYQPMPDAYDHNIGASSFKGFGTAGWNPSYTSGLENIGTINNYPCSYFAGIQLNNDRELVASDPMRLNGSGLVNGTAGNEGITTGPARNATVQHLAPRESSSSAGFANANYQYPLALVSANEQESTPMLPPLSSHQQHRLGNNAQNDFINSGLMNNADASVIGNTAQLEQFGEGIDFDNFLLDPSDYQFLFQQQDEEGALNPNSGTCQAQHNLPTNQSQNPELYAAFSVGDNAPNPWYEPTLEQLLEIEQLLNQELSGNADNANPLIDYYPSFDQNANQLQQGNQSSLNNSELNGLNLPEISPSGNQSWDEEFINSLLQNDPY